MNQNAALLGYLAFGSLKKLIPKVQLIDVFPTFPYVTVRLQAPFELQETLLTIFKEDLRGVIKKAQYKIFEMVPQVALDYARHKQCFFELVNEDPVITLLELDHMLMQVQGPLEFLSLDQQGYDLIHINAHSNYVYDLTLVLGDDVKNLKKILKSLQDFKLIEFLKNTGVLDNKQNVLSQRGVDVVNFYTQVVCSQLLEVGCRFLAENPNEASYVLTSQKGGVFEDPLMLGDISLESSHLCVKIDSSSKKINSCLKSLIKILKMMALNFQVHVYGKYHEAELKEITLGIDELVFLTSDIRCLELKVLDGINRYKTVAKFYIFKKSIELSFDLLNLIFANLSVHRKIYPENLERPKQVAVYGDLNKYKSLSEAYFKSRLKGESGFTLDIKDLLSSKDALDYQIDKMIYFSVTDEVVKEKSYD